MYTIYTIKIMIRKCCSGHHLSQIQMNITADQLTFAPEHIKSVLAINVMGWGEQSGKTKHKHNIKKYYNLFTRDSNHSIPPPHVQQHDQDDGLIMGIVTGMTKNIMALKMISTITVYGLFLSNDTFWLAQHLVMIWMEERIFSNFSLCCILLKEHQFEEVYWQSLNTFWLVILLNQVMRKLYKNISTLWVQKAVQYGEDGQEGSIGW